MWIWLFWSIYSLFVLWIEHLVFNTSIESSLTLFYSGWVYYGLLRPLIASLGIDTPLVLNVVLYILVRALIDVLIYDFKFMVTIFRSVFSFSWSLLVFFLILQPFF